MHTIRLVFLALLIGISASAQEKPLPLKKILDDISAQHRVTFNYLEDELVVYILPPPPGQWPLSAKIDYIRKRTRLEFTAIGNNSYAIFNDKKLDKPLCGFLKDAATGKPVEAASVIIENSDFSSVSDANGYFELPVVSPNMIVIRHQNYEPFAIAPTDLYRPGCPDIVLQPVINTLREIVAQRYLTTGISKNADGTFRIKPRNFGILPGLDQPDVQQTMQQLPGVNSEDETISNISVRGGTHDQNLFLWNGIRMFQTGHFFGLISVFNPALPQNIVIAKNGTNAFFGESVSSLVDISTHSKAISETKTVLSGDMISVQAASTIKLSDNSGVGFSVRRSYTDIFTTPTYHNFRKRIFQNTIVTDVGEEQTIDLASDEHFYFCDFTLQYQQNLGRHNFSADAIGITNQLIIDQFLQDAEKNNDLSQLNYGASFNWDSEWNKRSQSTFNTYVSYYRLQSSTETFSTGQLLEQHNKVLDKGFRFSHQLKPSEFLTLRGGYQFNETGVTNFDQINSPFFSRNTTEIGRTHAVVFEAAFNPASPTLLKAGLRANYYERAAKLIPEIRLNYSHDLNEYFRIEVLGEQKSQSMLQIIDRQQDFLGIEKRRWALADGNYPLQQSSQMSVGITFQKNNWLVAIENFYKEVVGITTSEQGFQNQFELINSPGNYRAIGSELLVQKNFGRYYTWLNYSVNDNHYEFKDLSPQRFPNNFELAHAISGAAIYEWHSLKIALGAKWHSGRPITTPLLPVPDTSNPLSPQIVYDGANNDRLPNFFQMNFSASKEWKFRKVDIQAGVSVINLMNSKNVVNRFYRVAPDAESINRYDTYALERTPNVNLKLSF